MKFTSRKDFPATTNINANSNTPLIYWMQRYIENAVLGVRSLEITNKISLHLNRFHTFFSNRYGYDRITAFVQRDAIEWRKHLIEQEQYAPSTVNSHMASLSSFTTWVHSIDRTLFPNGDPTKGIGDLPLPPLEPRTLTEQQVNSLKNLCYRLTPYYRKKGCKWAKFPQDAPLPLPKTARPKRDKALVFVFLSTGLRREELVQVNLDQLQPNTPEALVKAKRARILRVQGKGKTFRTVFLSADARDALADYMMEERPQDTGENTLALFLSANGIPARKTDGRLSPRSINHILNRIGRWHDAEQSDPERYISPLRPHNLRHTFAFRLSRATGADPYELERRLGHQSQRYIQRYTNPPDSTAAAYVEDF